MGSFREMMQQPLKIEALSVCKYCGKPIEKRGSLWYASGEGVAADLCLKARRGDHKPIKYSIRPSNRRDRP